MDEAKIKIIYKMGAPGKELQKINQEEQEKIITESRMNHKADPIYSRGGALPSQKYKNGRTDGFCLIDGNVIVAETRGYRTAQEDTYTYGELPKTLSTASKKDVQQGIEHCFSQLDASFSGFSDGSCVISSIAIWDNPHQVSIYTANMGDSFAAVLVLDKDNKPKKINLESLNLDGKDLEILKKVNKENNSHLIQLNRLHKPSDPEEAAKIKNLGGQVSRKRLNDELAISRAIGDGKHRGKGLIYEVEVTRLDLKFAKGDQVLLINTCDGVTDGLTKKEIEKFIIDRNAQKMAGMVYQSARVSGDNSTCVRCELMPMENCYVNVNDGHGGNKVSIGLEEEYPKCLKASLAEQCKINADSDSDSDMKIETLEENNSTTEGVQFFQARESAGTSVQDAKIVKEKDLRRAAQFGSPYNAYRPR